MVDDMAYDRKAPRRRAPTCPPGTPPELLPELLTSGQAAEWLGTTRRTMSKLIDEGTLKAEPNPLDERYKLLRRADVVALRQRSMSPRLAADSRPMAVAV
jgi:hypothetical protein